MCNIFRKQTVLRGTYRQRRAHTFLSHSVYVCVSLQDICCINIGIKFSAGTKTGRELAETMCDEVHGS